MPVRKETVLLLRHICRSLATLHFSYTRHITEDYAIASRRIPEEQGLSLNIYPPDVIHNREQKA